MNTNIGKRICCFALALAFVVLMIPSFSLELKAAYADGIYTFEAGDVAVITEDFINTVANGLSAEAGEKFRQNPVFQITQGVYSVTVSGDIDVTVIFGTESGGTYTGVTIDRTNETVSNNNRTNARVGNDASGYADLSVLYAAGQKLNWSRNNSTTRYYVPTAPFMIMGGAKVKTLFLGDCTIKAGLNCVNITQNETNQGSYWNPNYVTTYSWSTESNRCGYAGIQVDGTSSLEIMDVTGGKLSVYGGYQLAGTNGYDTDPLKVNPIFDNKNGRDPYATPSGADYRYRAGGAAIGGGAPYNADDSVSVGYKAGTPGTIIINGGEIYAVGGHLAAAIGGAFNGASTTSKIEINGGNITAIGGRYATGIGDGDTVDRQYTDNRSGPSPCFGEPAQIIINGGTIDAYGGTAAAAIGTGDKITMSEGLGETARSRLQISINGGVINAQSGEADTNSWAGEVTAAAIGVGQSTYMVENSITIHSNATVFARSFSIYAISEKPITENQAGTVVPMVNIDPDGYMYLARFTANNDYARQLTLYPVFRDIMDNPISFQGDAYRVLEGEELGTLYAVDPSDSCKMLYPVKTEIGGDNKPTFVIDGSTYDDPKYFLNTDSSKNNFSYYYDKTAPRVFEVPANYKAVAISLKKGDYVFHIPMNLSNGGANASRSDDVYAHFNKELPGTTSVQVLDDTNQHSANAYTPYHFLYYQDDKGNTQMSESPNVRPDGTAKEFTNIRLIADGKEVLGLNNQTHPFLPTTLGYKIYLPHGTTTFDLNLQYLIGDVNVKSILLDCEGVTPSGSEITGESINTLDGDNTVTMTFKKDDNGNDITSAEIWIHKTDTATSGQVYLTYKITVMIKPQYFMHMNSLSKKYDGVPVDPQILTVTESRGGSWTDWLEPHTAEYGQFKSTHTESGNKSESWTQKFNNIPVTICYELIPNETETAISVKTYFEYEQDGNHITKVSTVNANFESDDKANPKPFYTLGGASDTVLMTSNAGNYRIAAEDVDGNWYIYIVYYDRENHLQQTKDLVLIVDATMRIQKRPALDGEIPQYSSDGKKVWSSKNEAIDFAKREATAALDVDDSECLNGLGFEGTYTRNQFADYDFNTATNAWKDRYSDSYFYADGTTEVHTDTVSILREIDGTPIYTYNIEHDFMYMYHKFHYYAQINPTGEEIPFSAEDIAMVEIEYYLDLNEDGVLDDNNNGRVDDAEAIYLGNENNPPKDAGDYILAARYVGETFEAYSYVAFEIRKRPIQILSVQNWLKYLSEEEMKALQTWAQPTHLKTFPINPKEDRYDYQSVIFDDVVDGETVVLNSAIYAYFNEITISHNEKKITIRYDAEYDTEGETVLAGYQSDWLKEINQNGEFYYPADNKNYELTGVSNFRYVYKRDAEGNIVYESGNPVLNDVALNFSYVHVPGTLSYVSEGTIFQKTEKESSVWRKFWPDWDENFLKWDTNSDPNELGHFTIPDPSEGRIDYHSPSNASHQNYVYLRTLHANRDTTYSIDIEYGSMQFVFAKSVWDVNELDYVATDDSFWLGNDGSTNQIKIVNRSDADIEYSISVEKDTTWGYRLNVALSEYPDGEDANGMVDLIGMAVSDVTVPAPLGADGQGLGRPNESSRYLIISGNPLNTNKQQVGTITVTVGPASDD